MGINYFDLIILVIIISFSISSLLRGFIKEFFSLFDNILAIIFTLLTMDYFTKFLISKIGNFKYIQIISFILMYFVFLLIFKLILHPLENAINNIVEESQINGINKLLGFLFGLTKAILIIVLIVIFYQKYFYNINLGNFNETINNSITYKVVKISFFKIKMVANFLK